MDRNRVCAREGCENPFYATRRDKIYCTKACTAAVAQERYVRTHPGREYQRRWQEQHPEKQREYGHRWYENGGREKRAAAKRANREKVRAHTAVLRAIELGQLVRQPCEVCGAAKVDGHHDDYEKPLEVRWLCRRHHVAVHSGRVVLSQSA